ncbi:Clp protease N-terminal domain-containing protein [Streptomyces zagrosensis]|uniref:Clp protease N-terminal domain-containing protein n=1 Tax=Streptomyces zagrosensis TaxID=1042984 RepID=UPI001C888E9A|nr:Clp protease N-terminal domain-containing protein [Streptomyces zagrosensis]
MDGADAAVRGAGASAVGLSDELTSVIAAARRRAQRDGDRQIDTAHLLHTLLETVPCVAASLEGGPTQVARLLGYLAQRTIGYGLSWYGTVEDSGAVPRMREGGAHWSPTVEAAVARAGERARARGAVLAQGFDLFVAVTDDRECRAVEVLHRAGVDLDSLALRLAAESARLATEVARSQLDDGPVNG